MPALRVAAPAVLIVLVVAFGLHGKTTLTFQELGALYIADPGLRCTVFALWTLVMAPAARLSIMSQGLFYLRWLPLPGPLIAVHLVGLLAVLHLLPVIPLFIAGFPTQGISMLLAMMATSSCLLPGARSRTEHLLRAVGVAGPFALILKGHWSLAIGFGLVVVLLRVPRVWRIAPEHSHWRSALRWVAGGPWRALLSAQLVHIWRCEASALSRALLVSALGVFLILLVARANQGHISEGSLLVTSTPTIAAVSIMVALVLKRARRNHDWILRSLGVSRVRERLVSLAILFAANAVLTFTMLILVSAAMRLTAALVVHAAAWAVLALGISSRSQEDVRSASITLAVALIAIFAIGLGGRAMLGAELGAGLLTASRVLFREVKDA